MITNRLAAPESTEHGCLLALESNPVFLRRTKSGIVLIAWIGVLAVAAILAAFLLPALIREIDFSVARDETAMLKRIGDALQDAVQHNSYIPAQTNWADLVSTETGIAAVSLTNNARHQPRVLLVDTNGWFSNVGLPYTQTYAGTTILPLNARMIVITSLGQPLPQLDASAVSALWNVGEGNLPNAAPWTTWTGRAQDVKLQRINLTPLFVSLYLTTYASATNGAYSIGADPSLYLAPYASPSNNLSPHFFLMGTVLKLYNTATNGTVALDSSQILIRDGSFMYENNVWKSSAAGGVMPGGVDISGVVSAFLNAVPNTSAHFGATQQRLVVQSMMSYMSNYMVWADGGFTDSNMKTYLKNTLQPSMMATVQDLFMGSYYPANSSACQ